MLARTVRSPALMHIPDGFLSIAAALVCWALAAVAVGIALRRSSRDLQERQVPLMGVLAAFVFAAQMLNFPIIGGTSGHVIGAALAAILLGPWGGILALTVVVAVQALLFQDGGLLAMGANVLNMAVIAPLVAYGIYRGALAAAGNRRWGPIVGGFLAAGISVVASAIACAVELAVSGTSALAFALPAMAAVHALIGIGEGLITAGALAFITRARRDLLTPAEGARGGLRWAAVGLALTLVVTVLAPLASTYPDGLERVAHDLGFAQAAQASLFEVIPDYLLPGIGSQALATIAAGLVGTAAVGGLIFILAMARLRSAARPADG